MCIFICAARYVVTAGWAVCLQAGRGRRPGRRDGQEVSWRRKWEDDDIILTSCLLSEQHDNIIRISYLLSEHHDNIIMTSCLSSEHHDNIIMTSCLLSEQHDNIIRISYLLSKHHDTPMVVSGHIASSYNSS